MERIPEEQLEIVRLNTKRRAAAAIVAAMAADGSSMETLSERIGEKTDYVWNCLRDLISGDTKELDLVSDLAFAMGAVLQFRAMPWREIAALYEKLEAEATKGKDA